MVSSESYRALVMAFGFCLLLLTLLAIMNIGLSFTPFYAYAYTHVPIFPGFVDLAIDILAGFNALIYAILLGPFPILWTIIGAPVLEEIEFRGLLWYLASRKNIPNYLKVTLSIINSVIFALCHTQPIGFTINLIGIGLISCWLVFKTKKLYVPMIFHSIYNILITAVKG